MLIIKAPSLLVKSHFNTVSFSFFLAKTLFERTGTQVEDFFQSLFKIFMPLGSYLSLLDLSLFDTNTLSMHYIEYLIAPSHPCIIQSPVAPILN